MKPSLPVRDLLSSAPTMAEAEVWGHLQEEKAGKARPYIMERLYRSASKLRREREQAEMASETVRAYKENP